MKSYTIVVERCPVRVIEVRIEGADHGQPLYLRDTNS